METLTVPVAQPAAHPTACDVGTLCMVALMISSVNSPLFLQVKQANASVLEAFAGKSAYPHDGRHVVMDSS